jgi:lipopolysaccharide export system permease protein
MVLTFFMVVFIMLMQFLWKYIDDLVGKGLETKILAEFLLYSSASTVTMALPLAVLLSSLMTFGNLAENLELLAFKSSGVSLSRIMAPLVYIVLIITMAAFFFANNIMPVSNLKLIALLHDIQRQRPQMQIQPGIFDNTMEGFSIRIGDQDHKTTLLTDIWIYDHRDKKGNISVTVADSGYMKMSSDEKHLALTLYNGHSYEEMEKISKNSNSKRSSGKTYPHRRDKFSKQELLLELTGFGLNRSDMNLWKNSFSMLNLKQLNHFEDTLTNDIIKLQSSVNDLVEKSTSNKLKRNLKKNEASIDSALRADMIPAFYKIDIDSAYNSFNKSQKRRAVTQALNLARTNKSFVLTNANNLGYKTKRLRRYQNEKHRKFTLSFSCLIFFFIGAPLGAIIRKGGLGMPVIISVLFFLVWYMISITGEKFVREDMLSPFVGMWISSFILIPLGLFLSYKASRDSVILNVESYFTFFKKLRVKLYERIRQTK